MTGTSKSMLDSIPAFGIDLIYQLFVEFGKLKKRNAAVQQMKLTPATERVANLPSVHSFSRKRHEGQDTERYQQFKAMFGTPEAATYANAHPPRSPDAAKLSEVSTQLSQSLNRIVDDFVESVAADSSDMSGKESPSNPVKEKELRRLHEKLRQQRAMQIEQLTKDPDYILHLQRVKQERATRMRFQSQRYTIASTRPSSAGGPSIGPLSPTSAASSTTTTPSTFVHVAHLENRAAHDLALSHQAKKVAFATLRRSTFSATATPGGGFSGGSTSSGCTRRTGLPAVSFGFSVIEDQPMEMETVHDSERDKTSERDEMRSEGSRMSSRSGNSRNSQRLFRERSQQPFPILLAPSEISISRVSEIEVPSLFQMSSLTREDLPAKTSRF